MDPIQLIDKDGTIYEAADQETAQKQIEAYGLTVATPEQVQAFDNRKAAEAAPITSRLQIPLDVVGGKFATAVEGVSRGINSLTGYGSKPGLAGEEDGARSPGAPNDDGTYVRKQDVAPYAFSGAARARAEVYPGTALASEIGADIGLGAIAPEVGGVAGFGTGAALLGSSMEAEQARQFDKDFSVGDAAFYGLTGEVLASLSKAGLGRLFRQTGDTAPTAIDAMANRAEKASLDDAVGETDPALRAQKIEANAGQVNAKAVEDLKSAVEDLTGKLEKNQESVLSDRNIADGVSKNFKVQSDSILGHAINLEGMARGLDMAVPEQAAYSTKIYDGLDSLMDGKQSSASLFKNATNLAKDLSTDVPASLSESSQKAIDEFVSSLKDESTWGSIGKRFGDIDAAAPKLENFREMFFDADGQVNKKVLEDLLSGKVDKTHFDSLLEQAQTLNQTLRSSKLGNTIGKARDAYELGTQAQFSSVFGQARGIVEKNLKRVIQGAAAVVGHHAVPVVGGYVGHSVGEGLADTLAPTIMRAVDNPEYLYKALSTIKNAKDTVVQTAGRALTDANLSRSMAVVSTVGPIAGATLNVGMSRFIGDHDSPLEAYQDKRQILDTISKDPTAMIAQMSHIYQDFADVAPELHANLVKKTIEIQQFLQSKLPQQTGVSMVRPEGTLPDRFQVRSFGLYYSAATDPSSVFEDTRNGRVTQEQIEALRTVWAPEYEKLKTETLLSMAQSRPSLQQRARMDALFGFGESLDAALSWNIVSAYQGGKATKAATRSAGRGGKLNGARTSMPGGIESLSNPQS